MKSIHLIFIILILSLSFSAKAQNQVASYDFWFASEQNHTLSVQSLNITTGISQQRLNVILDPNKSLSRALFSSDRRWLAYSVGFSDRYDIYLLNLETGQQQVILSDILREDDGFSISLNERIQVIEWSPVSSFLLIRAYTPDIRDIHEFYIYDVASGLLRQLEVPERTSIGKVDWAEDGHLLVLKTVCVQGVGCETVPAIWDAANLTEIASFSGDFSVYAPNGLCEIRWSPDERYIAYVEYCDSTAVDIEKEVYVYDTVENILNKATSLTNGISLQNIYYAQYSLTWTDNDTLLIGTLYDNASGFHTETLTYDASTNSLSTLFPLAAEDWEISPDGQRIAYRAFTASDFSTRNYSARFSSIGNLSNFNEQTGVGCNFMWSADSRWLAYSEHTSNCRGTTQQFRFFDVESSESYTIPAPTADTIIPLGWVQRDAVSSLSLLASDNSVIADPLANNASIDLATVTASPLKLRANSNPATVGSVKFELSGSATASFTDNSQPYEMDWIPAVGSYTLTATPYSGADGTGTADTPYTINFSTTYGASISGVSLVDPSTGTGIVGFNPLQDGAVIDLTTMTVSPVHITATWTGSLVGSVKFILDGGSPQNDNTAPYQLENWIPTLGQHTLTVTLHSGANGTGNPSTPFIINFTIVRSATISGVRLLDSANNPVPGYDPLNNNAVIDLATVTASPLHFRATTNSATGSVRFELNGQVVSTDNSTPFEYEWTPLVGDYILTATPYSGTDTAGTPLTINFTVTNSLNRILYISGGNIWIMNANGTNPQQLTMTSYTEEYPVFSPNASKIAYSAVVNGDSEIFMMNSDGTNPVQLTNNNKNDRYPSFSPDGTRIAFASDRSGDWDILIMNADGTNQVARTNNLYNDLYPSWSPTGDTLAFSRNNGGDYEIYTIPVSSGNGTALTINGVDDIFPNWSPDGSKIVFTHITNTNTDVFSMNANGTNQLRLTNNISIDESPNWSADGTQIIFSSNRTGQATSRDLYTMNASDGFMETQFTFTNATAELYPSWGYP